MTDLLTLPPWHLMILMKEASITLKEDLYIPDYVGVIAAGTVGYESSIRELWNRFKRNPTTKNAEKFIAELKKLSSDDWRKFLRNVLDVEFLSDEQEALLDKAVAEHHKYLSDSLLPDLLKALDSNAESFDNFDYRVIFLYAGALWSFGFLATVTFDGLSIRDLADLFLFTGPDDNRTCPDCKKYDNNIFTVAQILAQNIIPGKLKCLTSCRHILIPIASPLKH